MGTSLSGLTPATTFDGLLKTSDNDALDATLKTIGTGDGTDSILQLSNSALQVNGAATINGGQATIVGAGNDGTTTAFLVQNSDGAELLDIDDNGTVTIGRSNGKIVASPGGLVSVPGYAFSHTGGGKATFDNGGVKIIGSGATSATTSLLVQNSAGTDMLKVQDDGLIQAQNLKIDASSTLPLLYAENNTNKSLQLGNQAHLSAFSRIDFKTFDGSAYSEAMRITGNTDQFVGIGETTPTARLHVKGSGNTNTTTSLLVQNSDGTQLFKITDNRDVYLGSSSNYIHQGIFFQGNYNAPGDWNFGTASDLGAKLGIKGSGATSATTALLVQNSAGTDLLKVLDDGATTIKSNGSFSFETVAGTKRIEVKANGEVNLKGGQLAAYSSYNSSNSSLIVGSFTSPTARLQVKGSGNDATTTALLVQNSDGDDMLKVLDNGQISASGDRLTIGDSADVTLRILASGNAAAGNNYIQPLGTPANQRVVVTGNSVATIKAVDLDASNVYIGHGINQTAATGTLSIKGSGATSATTALLVQNSAGTELLKVVDDGQLEIKSNSGRVSTTSGTSIFSYSSGGGGVLDVNPSNGNSVKFRARGDNDTFLIQTNPAGDNVGIGASSPDSTAKLQVDSTTQGFLPPRMTTTERDAISTPAAGLMVYNTTTNKAQCYNGTAWQDLF